MAKTASTTADKSAATKTTPSSKTNAAAKPTPALKKLPPAAKPKAAVAAVPPAKTKAPAKSATTVVKVAKSESKPKPAVDVKEKARKPKLIRDSFTMPEAEYAALGEVKKACLKAGIDVKKSQLLRVGVALVRQLEIAKLKNILAGLPELKAGRPKK